MTGRFLELSWRVCAVLCVAAATIAMASASSASPPTFSKDAAPILFKHCANCHRAGEIASNLPLVSYEDARRWAEPIEKAVLSRAMPPWPADSRASLKFRNDSSLSQKDLDTLVAWVEAGTPRGNPANLPPLPDAEKGWLHPKGVPPDLIIRLPKFHIPAQGEIPYTRYLAKIPLAQDRWVVALQVRPSNRAVVHHMAITEVALDKGMTPADLEVVARQLNVPAGSVGAHPAVVDPTNPAVYDMLAVYTPGTTFEMYQDGSAKLLKGGNNMYLNFNMHYQTTGKPEIDQPSVAFWFARKPPQHQLYRVPASGQTIIAQGKELLTDAPGAKAEGTNVVIPPIPPDTPDYEVIGVTAYTEPVTIYQFQPHAHLRGKDFTYAVVYPDGREKTALTVPKYQFHWQLAYDLEKPLHLPAGSKLIVTAQYDNSASNEHLHHHHGATDAEHDPSPNKEVYFRDANQSWDEMFTPFIQYSIDSRDPARPVARQTAEGGMSRAAGQDSSPKKDALQIAELVGCLEQSDSAAWLLTHAGEALTSDEQTASSSDIKKAETRGLGDRQYQLLGLDVFRPGTKKGNRTEVKGILIKDASVNRVNVTSLQSLAATCP